MHIDKNEDLELYIDIACGERSYNDGQGNTVYFSLSHSRPDQILTAIKKYIELSKIEYLAHSRPDQILTAIKQYIELNKI
jgi:hypothetical protein